ncbi:sugar phosphate isomerase/epimerase family protein [Streptomyces californicus]|uniref:sugar phosphate isomerase/epimerase family protein n=1 Tax=Streptomyces californicus TaxID=67351 RepID=UPI0037D14EA6
MDNSRKVTPVRIDVLARITIQPGLHDLGRYVKTAQSEDFLLELMEPAYPKCLDELKEYFSHYSASAPEGLVRALHGPYIDITVHTADREIREASRRRVERSLAWARHIGAPYLILHINHLPMINEAGYDRQWLSGWLDFLGRQGFGDVTVVMENMWDRTPDLMLRLVEEFGSPRLRLCLDVAHWNVSGKVSPDQWLSAAGRYTAYVQYGDNHGDHDADPTLGRGTVDFAEVDRVLRAETPTADVMIGVGIDNGDRLGASLAFLRDCGLHPFPAATGGER